MPTYDSHGNKPTGGKLTHLMGEAYQPARSNFTPTPPTPSLQATHDTAFDRTLKPSPRIRGTDTTHTVTACILTQAGLTLLRTGADHSTLLDVTILALAQEYISPVDLVILTRKERKANLSQTLIAQRMVYLANKGYLTLVREKK